MKQINNKVNPTTGEVKEINYSYLVPDIIANRHFIEINYRNVERINVILHSGYHVEYWSSILGESALLFNKLEKNPENWKNLLWNNRSFNYKVIHKANV